MASKLRVDEIISSNNNVSIGTATFTGDVSANGSSQINVGDTFLKATNQVGLGTTSTAGRNAGINTAIGTLIYNADTTSIEGYGPTGWISVKALEVVNATGGTIINYSGYRYHVIASDQDFVVDTGNIASAEILVIGGGGGGSDGYGSAGGGAGSVVHATSVPISPGTYAVVVGPGGTGADSPGNPGPAGPVCVGGDGTASSIGLPTPIVANGGGGGGSGHSSDAQSIVIGRNGGSGGGGGYYSQPGNPDGPNAGGTGTAPPTSPASAAISDAGGKSYQNDGGAGWYNGAGGLQVGGGGGGAGGVGHSYNSTPKADGGDALAFGAFPAPVIQPGIPAPVRSDWTSAVTSTGFYAGGGGGAYQGNSNPYYDGGGGGAGNGGSSGGNGADAVDYTGSGGGAAGGPSMGLKAGDGGNGIVLIKYEYVT